MDKNTGFVVVQSDDLPFIDLEEALSVNSDTFVLSPVKNETNRGFQDVDWIMFMIMTIPVAESLLNIVTCIKDEIKIRISKHMAAHNIARNIKVKVNIKLPFFTYEREEEIFVESFIDDAE